MRISWVRRYASLFVRQHVWHATTVYLVARVAITGALAWSAIPPIDSSIYYGLDTACLMVAAAVILAAFDRRRVGTPVLMANLGVSTFESIALSAIPALVGETLLNFVVRV